MVLYRHSGWVLELETICIQNQTTLVPSRIEKLIRCVSDITIEHRTAPIIKSYDKVAAVSNISLETPPVAPVQCGAEDLQETKSVWKMCDHSATLDSHSCAAATHGAWCFYICHTKNNHISQRSRHKCDLIGCGAAP